MCLRPISITRRERGHVVVDVVACGRCPQCLKKKQQAWEQRTIIEAEYWLNDQPDNRLRTMEFLTFTYDDEHRPFVYDDETGVFAYSLDYSHFNGMMRAFKKHYDLKEGDFSYICCGEYGNKTHKPHHHCLFFGLDNSQIHYLIDYWKSRYCPKAREVMESFEQRTGRKSYEIGVYRSRCKTSSTDITKVAKYVSKYTSKGVFDTYCEECQEDDLNVCRCRVRATRSFGFKDTKRIKQYQSIVNRVNEKSELEHPFIQSVKMKKGKIVDNSYFATIGNYKYSDVNLLVDNLKIVLGCDPFSGKPLPSTLCPYLLDKLIPKIHYGLKDYDFQTEVDGTLTRIPKVCKRTLREFAHYSDFTNNATLYRDDGQPDFKVSLRTAYVQAKETAHMLVLVARATEYRKQFPDLLPTFVRAYAYAFEREQQQNETICSDLARRFVEFYSRCKDGL